MQVGGGPFLGLGLSTSGETYQVNLFLESPLPQEGDWSEENSVRKPVNSCLVSLKAGAGTYTEVWASCHPRPWP